MVYVKKQREGLESYEHLQVAEEEAHNYLENGWETATLEEWEAQMASSEDSGDALPEETTEESSEAPTEEPSA